ncbi:MAG: hypothetical protein IPP64_16090 [Bacteroidetes bacterium]|nr:hypothetical protein [Bacteroidota bacterium]
MFAIIFAIMFAYPTIKKDRLINRIKQNPAFTVGTTTQWIDLRGLSDDVEYYYTVNGRRYVSKASPVYGGEEIAGIQVPNGLYRVIYNLANPEESLIDFKIKEGETTNAEVN